MLSIKKEGIILKKTTLDFENEGVLNPAIITEGGRIHLFYRAVEQGNFSSIGYCILSDPFTVERRYDKPVIWSEFECEGHGVEDPRIVKIDDVFYLTYTAYDGVNALGALAISKDLIHFEKRGIIVPRITFVELCKLLGEEHSVISKLKPFNRIYNYVEGQENKELLWDKNVIFFPRKIDNKFYILHRIKPDIQVIAVNDLDELTPVFWDDFFINIENHTVLSSKYEHEHCYIGGGCPPIETEYGWLLIYHGVRDSIKGRIYSACAALLDLDNPSREIARLPHALFEPEFEWELKGEVNNVCFPTGAVVFEDTLYLYYGAADERIGCASLSLSELLFELNQNQNQ